MTCEQKLSVVSDQSSVKQSGSDLSSLLSPLNPRERLRLTKLLSTRTTPGAHGSGCLEWTGGTKSASELYGAIWFRGRSDRVHRVMVMLNGGLYPPRERVVRHLCGNARCVNPDHLAVGTSRENQLDTIQMGRATRPKRLEPQDERRIKQLFYKGRSSWRIAERLKLSRSTVNNFLRRAGLCRSSLCRGNQSQSEEE